MPGYTPMDKPTPTEKPVMPSTKANKLSQSTMPIINPIIYPKISTVV